MKRKYYGRLMAIVLAVMMALGSFCISFAEGQDGQNPQGDADQTETVVPEGQDDPDGDTTGDGTIDNQNLDDQTGIEDLDGEEVQNDEEPLNEEPAEDAESVAEEENVDRASEKKFIVKREAAPTIKITKIEAAVTKPTITVRFSKVSGAKKYVVERRKGSKTTRFTVESGKYYYVDKTPAPLTLYGYKVYAYKDAKEKTLLARSPGKTVTTGGIANVGKISVYPGYQSVTLKWKKVKGASSYQIERWDSVNGKKKLIATATNKANTHPGNKKYIAFKDTTASGGNVKYAYIIKAVRKAKANGVVKTVRSQKVSVSPDVKCVRQMYQTIYFGESATLTSHAGRSVTRTFYPGTPIVTTGFGGGQYKFWYEGSLFYANYTRVSYATCDYAKNANYSKDVATLFINELYRAGEVRNSSSDYLIWVSTYTQHLYVFKWNYSTKKWVLHRDWECSTGGAGSPTRIDTYMNIEARYSYEGGIPWWNCFSGMNAIHGKKDSYVIDGAPHSHGCVRNYNSDAGWIWDNCPMGTPVAIY